MRLCAILSIIALALMPLPVAADATIVARVGKYGERTKDAVRAWLGTLGSAGDHNFGQAVSAIKSHALLLGFAETDISIESTRQLSSLLKAADDAVGRPSGRERVRKTGNTWTITPPAGISALGKQAASQVVASNLQVLDKRTVESRKETAVQANAAIELLESKNATLVANLEDAARREAMLLAQLAEARGASLLSSSSSSSSLPAASLPYPQVSHTHTAPTSIQYTRSQAMSVTHKYATREVYVLSGSSARKLPMVMSVAGWSVISELRVQGLLHEVPGQEVTLDDVLRVNSSSQHLGVILDECQVIDDYLLSILLESSVDEVFSVCDGGNTGDKKYNFSKIAGYDHGKGCIMQKMIGLGATEGGGEAIARSIQADGHRAGIVIFGGCTTDNASEMKSGFVRAMTEKNEFFVFVGCSLHILNLVLMNAYFEAYGPSEWSVPSAFRVSFMVCYLQKKFLAEWHEWCSADPDRASVAFLAAQGAATRWWSVVESFGDVDRNAKFYSAWFLWMAQGLPASE
jgi:hypothetical protein